MALISMNNGKVDYFMIAPAYPPLMGGVEKHVSEVHRALKRQGLNGQIIVLREPPSATAQEEAIWLDTKKLWGWVPRTYRAKLAIRFAWIVQRHPRAILHFHDFSTLYPLLPALRLLRRLSNTFMTFHGWEGVCPPMQEVIGQRQKCAKAVVRNMAIGDFIVKWYGTPADLVSYGGVDVARFSQIECHPTQLPLQVAYLGRFEKDTGILELVKAVRRYHQVSGKKVTLNLFGWGSLEGELRKMAADPSLSLTILPPVSDITPVLADNPLIFASGYLTILEALCTRRIVFSYYNNPLREDYLRLHPAAKAMFICGNAEDVIKGLSECHQNLHAVCQRSEKGWQWAKEQSWHNLATHYLSLWKKDH